MTSNPKRLCLVTGCGELSDRSYCPAHRPVDADTRGTRHQRGYGTAWEKLRRYILMRDPVCAVAGCNQPSTDADHILPRRLGGTDNYNNLQGLCHKHHSEKTRREYGYNMV